MFGIDTQQKLKDVLLCYGEGEIQTERLRQMLAKLPDFEPYAAFKRIDWDLSGFLTATKLT